MLLRISNINLTVCTLSLEQSEYQSTTNGPGLEPSPSVPKLDVSMPKAIRKWVVFSLQIISYCKHNNILLLSDFYWDKYIPENLKYTMMRLIISDNDFGINDSIFNLFLSNSRIFFSYYVPVFQQVMYYKIFNVIFSTMNSTMKGSNRYFEYGELEIKIWFRRPIFHSKIFPHCQIIFYRDRIIEEQCIGIIIHSEHSRHISTIKTPSLEQCLSLMRENQSNLIRIPLT